MDDRDRLRAAYDDAVAEGSEPGVMSAGLSEAIEDFRDAVWYRYNEDALFHARVNRAMHLLDVHGERREVMTAVAFGLHMADYDPNTMKPVEGERRS